MLKPQLEQPFTANVSLPLRKVVLLAGIIGKTNVVKPHCEKVDDLNHNSRLVYEICLLAKVKVHA